MKQYPKTYENVYDFEKAAKRLEPVSSTLGSPEALANGYRAVFRSASREIFDQVVKYYWLERQFVYKGKRKTKRTANSFEMDHAYGTFLRVVAGGDQKFLTQNKTFEIITMYVAELFPDILDHNPFTDADHFKYPFEHVTIDQMMLVYQVHNRMELLRYSDKEKMTFAQFFNWAINWVFSYNEEQNKEIYQLSVFKRLWPTIKRVGKQKTFPPTL